CPISGELRAWHGAAACCRAPGGMLSRGCLMSVLAVDVGGTHVKILATGQETPRRIVSGPKLTAARMVTAVKELAQDWSYEAVAIGYPGPVLHGKPVSEPHNL